MTSLFNPPERTIEEWREVAKHFGKEVGDMAPISFLDVNICVTDNTSIQCRVFNDQLSNAPALIFYPGCSFIFNFLEVNSVISSHIASLANIKVILVNHRLAPENSIQTCLRDCSDAASFIALNPVQFGIDTSKIFVGGWSSGAHAATFVSNKAPFKIFHQILLAGSFDYSHSHKEFNSYEVQDPTLDRRLISHFASQFYSIADYRDPKFSPFWENDFTHFPSTTLLCGEFDAFRNDTEAYFTKLEKSKIQVEKIILPGQSHNTIVMNPNEGLAPIKAIAKVIKDKTS